MKKALLCVLVTLLFMIEVAVAEKPMYMERTKDYKSSTLLKLGFRNQEADRVMEAIKNGEPHLPFSDVEFEEYNSPAEENGHGGEWVIIYGTIREYKKYKGISSFVLKEDDGDEWIVSYEANNMLNGTSFEKHKGKQVEVYGEYVGFSEVYKKPGVAVVSCGGMYVNEINRFIMHWTAEEEMYRLKGVYHMPALVGAKEWIVTKRK